MLLRCFLQLSRLRKKRKRILNPILKYFPFSLLLVHERSGKYTSNQGRRDLIRPSIQATNSSLRGCEFIQIKFFLFGIEINVNPLRGIEAAFGKSSEWIGRTIGSIEADSRLAGMGYIARFIFAPRQNRRTHRAANGVVADCFFSSLSLLPPPPPPLPAPPPPPPLSFFLFFCCTSTAVSLARDKAVETKATSSLPAKVKG